MTSGSEWRPVDGFEDAYIVNDQGEIISLPRNGKPGKTLKLNLMPNGYLMADLFKNGEYTSVGVHRVVAKAFCPNPLLKEQVNHLNGNRTDNRAENLQWVTARENERHKHEVLGTGNSPHPTRRRLTAQQVRAIRSSKKSGRELAREFGVSHSAIRNIQARKVYKEVE